VLSPRTSSVIVFHTTVSYLLYAARSRVLLDEPLVVESRQTHFWWQILRLRWR
jgi:hypothetical protein